MYKATIDQTSFEISADENDFIINGSRFQWDLVQFAEGYFHILVNNKSYRAEVVKSDRATKTFVLKINGRIYTVELKDRFDLLLDKMGMNNASGKKVNNIKAPMPGLIIDLKVREGDSVISGDALLVLEAMKMENIIKASASGVVKSVKVKKGDSVEKNQILIEF